MMMRYVAIAIVNLSDQIKLLNFPYDISTAAALCATPV